MIPAKPEAGAAGSENEAGEAHVIPVILRSVNWEKAPFAKLQALPEGGKAVAVWGDKDTAWQNVAAGIERVVHELRKERGLK